MTIKYKKILKEGVIYLILFIVISYGINFYKTLNVINGKAPDLIEKTITGEVVDLKAINKPVLVHFWATWCPICSIEQDSIQSISSDYEVISIALQSGDESTLQVFMQDQGLSFKVIADDNGELSKLWGVKGVPSSFIISSTNDIQFVDVGYTSEIGLRVKLWWVSE